MTESVFKTMAQDITAKIGTARDLDLNPMTRTGRVLSYDNFEAGFGRWADHYSGTPQNPMSLCSDRALSGSRSLMLSTRNLAPHNADWLHGSASTYNRMSRDFHERYVDFSCLLAVGGTDAFAVGSFYFFLDTQTWDSTQRSFFRVRSSSSSTTGLRTWAVANGTNFVNVPGTGSGHAFPGYNESKLNSSYVRITLDMQANDGKGGFVEAQFGDKLYDLTSLGAIPEQQTPQYDPADENQSFAGGFNPGFAIGNLVVGSVNAVEGEAWLILDEVTVTARKEL